MDARRNDLLGELAADAALERRDFLVQATEQLRRFLDANEPRIRELGGMVLIDDDADYLSIAPDLTFRSRSRFLDEVTGEWNSETEVIEGAAELVELYNPADVYAAFADASREAAGMGPEPTATDDLMETAGIAPDETVGPGGQDPYVAAADDWAAAQSLEAAPDDDEAAARQLYDLALTFQERSQRTEAHLLEQFETAAGRLTGTLGDLIVVDDEDERLTLQADGSFVAEVVPEAEESAGEWRRLQSPEELVEFYDPTDVFGDLADAVAEAYPEVAPELARGDGSAEDVEPDEDVESDDEGEDDELEAGQASGSGEDGRRP